jgi:acyl-CoA thioesterase
MAVPERPKRVHFGRHVGIRWDSAERGRARNHVDIADIHMNPNGIVHGGVTYSLVDQAMGAALYTTLQPGEAGTTLEIKINYLRAVKEGRLTCDAWLVQREGDFAVLESEVLAGDALICKGLGTYMVLAPRPARPAPQADAPAPPQEAQTSPPPQETRTTPPPPEARTPSLPADTQATPPDPE